MLKKLLFQKANCDYTLIFGLAFVSDFLLKYQTVIHAAGGSLILAMGLRLILKKGEESLRQEFLMLMGGCLDEKIYSGCIDLAFSIASFGLWE